MVSDHNRPKWLVRGGTLALAALFVVGALALPARVAVAQEATATAAPLPRTITVVGIGKVRVEVDTARVNIGVEVARPTVREASDANKELIDSVIAAVQDAGVAEDDIQTSGFSVYAERFGVAGPLPEDEVKYRVSNNVNVTVRDLESVSAVLDAAIEAGANNIYGVEFSVSDPAQYESDAMAKAMDGANAKAAELAELAGVSVGEIVSVSEVVGMSPLVMGVSAAMGMGGGGGTPIQPGMTELTLQLQVVYAIAP